MYAHHLILRSRRANRGQWVIAHDEIVDDPMDIQDRHEGHKHHSDSIRRDHLPVEVRFSDSLHVQESNEGITLTRRLEQRLAHPRFCIPAHPNMYVRLNDRKPCV
jgi:hypothetical protein